MNDTDIDMELSSGLAAFESKAFARAAALLGPLAEAGNPEAQHRLGIIYQNGLGMARNELLAYKWMQMAAKQDHALAQHGMGFMYLEGDCVSANGAKAVTWFEKAAKQGLAGSQATLGRMYTEGLGVEKDVAVGKKWYREAGFDEV